jgi:hypothetical protein
MSVTKTTKEFYTKCIKEFDTGVLVAVLLTTLGMLIALTVFLGFFVGAMFLIFEALKYVLAIIYAPAALKLAELGLFGFILLFILTKWALKVVAKPFTKTVVVAKED